MASLPSHNLFSSLPTVAPPSSADPSAINHQPPIPIPKYKPRSKPLKSQNLRSFPPQPKFNKDSTHPSFRIPHRRTKFYKPINDVTRIPSPDGERSIQIGESGVSYLLPGAPFEFQFSYSETPKAKPLALREPTFLPFAPPSMPRPWTGKPPLKSKKEKLMKKKIPLFDSFNPPPPGKKGVKYVEMPGPYKLGQFPKVSMTREEILGEPLSKAEIKLLIQPHLASNRQVNLGRDGLTHNMLDLVHTHWKRRRVCKVKCKGVPTVDMNNVCKHLEERTGGKIIHRVGGVVYLFRGRNYNYRTRPQYPLMLWKPAAPVYPKLIQEAPEGLTKKEADDLRKKGKQLKPICKLSKNGVYTSLVNDARHGFERSILVKIDCRGLDPSDYKRIGAKLKELVPCVLLSFDDEQVLMWRGHEWKSIYPPPPPTSPTSSAADESSGEHSANSPKNIKSSSISSPRMMSLWKHAIDSSKAMVLREEDIELDPDTLLEKVEEFDRAVQALEHSYPATLVSTGSSDANSVDSYDSDGSSSDDYDDDYFFDENSIDDGNLLDGSHSSVALGSLPVDLLAKRLKGPRN